MSTEISPVEAKPLATASIKETLSNYIREGKVVPFGAYDFHKKLALVQAVPKDRIKYRVIDGKQIPYMEHVYCRKIMNFLFDFRISRRIVHHEYFSYKSKKGKNVYEAEVDVEFLFTHSDGVQQMLTVTSSHRLYENIATCRGDAKKSAVSKSWTLVAREFGIGDSVNFGENVDIDMDFIEEERGTEAPQGVAKAFGSMDY